ncbi:MAG: right-handed parallel beta-helix repeat-containing protein [Deltaproteobacteria bacterium]|nr:right-handed parallel beta-helix repeat-containing protein [Deltaproteobacteria bacterium]
MQTLRQSGRALCCALSLAVLWAAGCSSGRIATADAGQDSGALDADAGLSGDRSADGRDGDGPRADGDAQVGDPGADPGQPPDACPPLGPPEPPIVTVSPGQAAELRAIVSQAQAQTTILLEDGLYPMDGGDTQSRLSFEVPDVTLRSASGQPEAVVLDGGYVTGELVSIAASRITIAELTLQRAYYHPIHICGGSGDIDSVRIYRVRVIDPAEQAIKINPSYADTYADRGTVACCTIELTEAGRAQVRNSCYTGGVDAHQAWGWEVRSNTISGFWCPQGLSEHGIHFWNGCRDTLVERNTIVDCARGIGFGLGESGNGEMRAYPDDPYPGVGYIGHYDGVIRNNFIAASSADLFASDYGFDAGISLDQARGSRVLHNTVASSQPPFSSIEWRFDHTAVELGNNLVTHMLRDRGGQAELAGNVQDAAIGCFADLARGDLHLLAGCDAEDAGARLEPGACDEDIDGQLRDARPDVGADERGD